MNYIHTIRVGEQDYAIGTAIDDSTPGEQAWSARNIVDRLCPSFSETGMAVRCQPVEGYPLTVTTEEGATAVTRWGKNRIDYTQSIPRNTNGTVRIIDGGVSWEGGNYFFFVPCAVRTGETVTFSCLDEAGEVLYAMLYNRGAKSSCSSQEYCGKPMVATADADAVCVYKKNPADNVETPIVLTRLQLETGSTATEYEPYRQPETFPVGQQIPAWHGTNTLVADRGHVTVTGKADPVPLLQSLMKQ